MWLGPMMFIVISVFLWKYVGAVFVPELIARAVFSILPALRDMDLVILINAAILYFGAYFAFAIFWPRLRPVFRSPFLAAMTLWLANVILIFPILGRGVFGYHMPQGWFAVSIPSLFTHWMFARGLQFQDRNL
jgi:hypothetical protein